MLRKVTNYLLVVVIAANYEFFHDEEVCNHSRMWNRNEENDRNFVSQSEIRFFKRINYSLIVVITGNGKGEKCYPL